MRRLLLLMPFCWPCWAQDVAVELMSSRIHADAIFPRARADVDLGPAPAPGVRRRVTRGQLVRWARQAGIPEADVPNSMILERKLSNWPQDEAIEVVRVLVAEAGGVAPEAVEVELHGSVSSVVPAGKLEWSLLGLPTLNTATRLAVRWRDEGGRTGVETLTGVVAVGVRGLAAAGDLPAGAEIALNDFVLMDLKLQKFGDVYLDQIQRDGVWHLMQNMKSGEGLRERLVTRRPDVERGAMLELLLEAGAVRLRAPGRAEGSGRVGDLIPFRNLATDLRVLARVRDSKTAEVAAP